MAKVNKTLYSEVKEAVQHGDYTVEEACDTLEWLRVELIRKRAEITERVKVQDAEKETDWFDEHHRAEDSPESD